MNKTTLFTKPCNENIRNEIKKLITDSYFFVNTEVIGKSTLGRPIDCYKIGNQKKKVLFCGAFHGMEWITSLVLYKLIINICDSIINHKKIQNEKLWQYFSNTSLVIIPCVNPDGVEICINGSKAGKGFESYIDYISQGDTSSWQANAMGVDINHNFNAEWYKLRDFERASGINEPCAGRYGGFFPESEQETKAITRLLRGIPVDMVISFHSQGEEIFYEYGNNTPEKAYTIAGVLSAVSGYRLVKNEGLYSSGGLKDWFIEEFRKPAFTIEVGKGENPLPLSEFDDIYNKIQTLLLMGLIL